MIKWIYAFVLNCFMLTALYSLDIPSCTDNNSNLIALVDRPSIAFSPCTVQKKSLLIESGYSYLQLTPTGFAHNGPQMEVRWGIGDTTELDVFPPNGTRQPQARQAGFGFSSVGIKHIAYYDSHQLFTIQGYITPPSGGKFYGTRSTEFLINGIYNYSFDTGISISTILGLAAQTEAPVSGSQTFYSVNPISVLSIPLSPRLNSYIEFYGQSQTAPNQGWGINFDTGLVTLLIKNMTLDIVYGQRISGMLNNIRHYIGGGMVIRFT